MKCYFWALDLVIFFRGCGVYAIRVPGAIKELELEFDHSLQLVLGLRMSVHLPLLCLFTFMASTGTDLPSCLVCM
jgi:hypothetical protein